MSQPSTNTTAVLPAPHADLVLEDRQIPSAGPGEIVIRNHVVALNPIDWKRQTWNIMVPSYPTVLGADLSGVVASVGPDTTAFKTGARVFSLADSFDAKDLDHGAFQTYTVVKEISTTPLPAALTFLQGATLPTATATAAMALFDVLSLPRPEVGAGPAPQPASILIWGGASTVGSMAIQLARLAGFTVLAAAGDRHRSRLTALGASAVVDYRSPTAVDDLLAAAEQAGKPIAYAVDAISLPHTLAPVAEVLHRSPGAAKGFKNLVHTLPWPQDLVVPEGVSAEQVLGEGLWGRRGDLGAWLTREALPRWLEDGAVVPGAYRVVEGGLGGIQSGLDELKKGAVSGEKLVVEV